MALILAIEPDRRQAAQLSQLVRTRVRADLVLAETTEGALGAIGNRVPDLILVPTLLSPQDDAALAGALRVIATAAHVNMLTIPVLAEAAAAAKPTGLFARFKKQPEPVSTGCDPSVFAEQIKAYLAEAAAEDDHDEFEEAPVEPVRAIDEFPAEAPPLLDAKTYRGFTEITDARTLRQMLEAPSARREEPSVVERPISVEPQAPLDQPAEPAQPAIVEPPVVVRPAALDRPLVVERSPVIEPPPIVVTPPPVEEPPLLLEPAVAAAPPVEYEEPATTEPHRLLVPAFVKRTPAAEKPAVEESLVKPVEQALVKPVEQVFVKPVEQMFVKPVEPPVVKPPIVEEPPVVVPDVIERPLDEPVASAPPPQPVYAQPLDAPSVDALAEPLVEANEKPIAPVVEEMTQALEKVATSIEIVVPGFEDFTVEEPPASIALAREQVEEEEEDDDPIALAIKHYVPKPRPEPHRPEPIAAEPPPVAPAARAKTANELGAEPGLTQSDLDMLYFVEQGTLPPTASAPRRKKPQRPEWGKLVAAVRVDVERMRAEGTEPAKRGQSGVRPAVGSTPPATRKTPKPIQDQWGLFDPEQCGFAALLAKLEEITETPEDASAKV